MLDLFIASKTFKRCKKIMSSFHVRYIIGYIRLYICCVSIFPLIQHFVWSQDIFLVQFSNNLHHSFSHFSHTWMVIIRRRPVHVSLLDLLKSFKSRDGHNVLKNIKWCHVSLTIFYRSDLRECREREERKE